MTAADVLLEKNVKQHLVQLQMNEVITTTILPSQLIELYQQHSKFPTLVTLQNPPDKTVATLRPSIVPNLVSYAKKNANFRQKRFALFEVGNIYHTVLPTTKKALPTYGETLTLGIILGGELVSQSWNKTHREVNLFDLKGILELLFIQLGFTVTFKPGCSHPSIDKESCLEIYFGKTFLGCAGALHKTIQTTVAAPPLFVAEISLAPLVNQQASENQVYVLAPLYPPIIEDLSFVVSETTKVGEMLDLFRTMSSLITDVSLIDCYKENRTFTITYQSPDKTLTDEEIKPIRSHLISQAVHKFGAKLKEK